MNDARQAQQWLKRHAVPGPKAKGATKRNRPEAYSVRGDAKGNPRRRRTKHNPGAGTYVVLEGPHGRRWIEMMTAREGGYARHTRVAHRLRLTARSDAATPFTLGRARSLRDRLARRYAGTWSLIPA